MIVPPFYTDESEAQVVQPVMPQGHTGPGRFLRHSHCMPILKAGAFSNPPGAASRAHSGWSHSGCFQLLPPSGLTGVGTHSHDLTWEFQKELRSTDPAPALDCRFYQVLQRVQNSGHSHLSHQAIMRTVFWLFKSQWTAWLKMFHP